jgi:hypothetical protein
MEIYNQINSEYKETIVYLINPLKPGLNYMYHMLVQSVISCILCLWLLYVSECKQRLLP